eukprot:TRINITY_DN3172_c0_g3_i2.p1 TRINITY_DN3172_c0_g3~~TRINITY_DN3172_c0_g3_i2.p1  ORF type:complete len:219 (-),score=60.25 TRINITY_DN3172_c0_g3_i2:1464-2075(-)
MAQQQSAAKGPSFEERMASANRDKDAGNQLFREGKTKEALGKYYTASMFCEGLQVDAAAKAQLDSLRVTIFLNIAACQLKVQNADKALTFANKALAIEATNPKALFRRGAAYSAKNDIDRAKVDLEKAASLAPGDQAIQRELGLLKHKFAAYERKAKAMFSGMLGGMSTSASAAPVSDTVSPAAEPAAAVVSAAEPAVVPMDQ